MVANSDIGNRLPWANANAERTGAQRPSVLEADHSLDHPERSSLRCLSFMASGEDAITPAIDLHINVIMSVQIHSGELLWI